MGDLDDNKRAVWRAPYGAIWHDLAFAAVLAVAFIVLLTATPAIAQAPRTHDAIAQATRLAEWQLAHMADATHGRATLAPGSKRYSSNGRVCHG